VYPSFIVDVIKGNDRERRRRRDDAWRAWHRQPDALPLPEEPPRSRTWHVRVPRIGLASSLAWLAGRIQLIRR
jgi:hypothetical protein